MRRFVLLPTLFLFMNLPIHATEIQHINTIVLEKPDELLSVSRFTATEDGLFIIPDQ